MIEIILSQLEMHFENPFFVFVIDPHDALSFSLGEILGILTNGRSIVIEKPGSTSGALCSCLLAIDAINHDEPLIICNSDQIIDDDLGLIADTFLNNGCSAGVVTFESTHPRWSYVVDGDNGEVIQTYEKRVASRCAIAGFYFFRAASIFFDAAKRVMISSAHVDEVYYISSSLNEIILAGGRVVRFAIPREHYHSFYSPAKIAEYERMDAKEDSSDSSDNNYKFNLVIPAAGEGSRFAQNGWKKPKPFIDIDGRPMLSHVIENVHSASASITVLLRQEHMDSYPRPTEAIRAKVDRIVPVSQVTEGTASTILLSKKIIDGIDPLLIANSDQLVRFDIDHFVNDCRLRMLDGSILVFRDPSMSPKWSFVRVSDDGLVLEVAEKTPISDLATVGIYLFSSGSAFIDSAIDMIVANDRTNGEFYTCPVYNYMIKRGAKIGVYEIPIEAMHGLGTPTDLDRFLKSSGIRRSADSPDSSR